MSPEELPRFLVRLVEAMGTMKFGVGGVPAPCLSSMTGQEIGQLMYNRIFDVKEARTARKGSTPGQRHQPANNKRARKAESTPRSIAVLWTLVLAFDQLPVSDASQPHYYQKATDILSCVTTGVHGAGGLTAQHLIGAVALLGLFPKELLLLAEIATTTATWELLSTNRGYKLENAAKEMPQLLAAVACSLNTTEFVAENAVCKQVQEGTGTGKRYVDSVFEGQFLYYL